MAKFSQAFLQGLLQPSFSQGMFDLGATIGGIPAARKAKTKEKEAAALQKGLFGLEQMAAAEQLTPEMLEEARGSYAALIKETPEAAKDIRSTLKSVTGEVREQGKKETSAKILGLQDELRRIAASKLPPDQKAEQTAVVQKQIREAAKGLSFAEQQALGARSEQITRSAAQDQRAETSFQNAQKRFNEWADNTDLREAEKEVALDRVEQYWENGFIREAEREEAAMKIALPKAKQLYAVAGEDEDTIKRAKEAFLKENPNMELVWEAAEQQVVKGRADLARSRDDMKSTKFNYTDSDLKEMGLSDSQITAVKSQPTNVSKNNLVYQTIKSNLTKGDLPSATLANLFVKASRARAAEILGITSRTPSERDKAKIDNLASEIGLAAAQEAQKEGNLNDGFAKIAGFQTKTGGKTDTSASTVSTSRASRINALDKELNP